MSEMVKHKNLSNINELRKQLITLCILDIIMLPKKESYNRYRHYVENSYIKHSEEILDVFKLDNGSGDDLYVIFAKEGCIIKGFAHESSISPYGNNNKVWKGIYDETPENLLSLLNDPFFCKNDVTFCVWRQSNDSDWLKGNITVPNNYNDSNFGDGFRYLCDDFLANSPSDYCNWAIEYHELFELNSPSLKSMEQTVKQIYDGAEINEVMIKALNPKRNVTEALKEISLLPAK